MSIDPVERWFPRSDPFSAIAIVSERSVPGSCDGGRHVVHPRAHGRTACKRCLRAIFVFSDSAGRKRVRL